MPYQSAFLILVLFTIFVGWKMCGKSVGTLLKAMLKAHVWASFAHGCFVKMIVSRVWWICVSNQVSFKRAGQLISPRLEHLPYSRVLYSSLGFKSWCKQDWLSSAVSCVISVYKRDHNQCNRPGRLVGSTVHKIPPKKVLWQAKRIKDMNAKTGFRTVKPQRGCLLGEVFRHNQNKLTDLHLRHVVIVRSGCAPRVCDLFALLSFFVVIPLLVKTNYTALVQLEARNRHAFCACFSVKPQGWDGWVWFWGLQRCRAMACSLPHKSF